MGIQREKWQTHFFISQRQKWQRSPRNEYFVKVEGIEPFPQES